LVLADLRELDAAPPERAVVLPREELIDQAQRQHAETTDLRHQLLGGRRAPTRAVMVLRGAHAERRLTASGRCREPHARRRRCRNPPPPPRTSAARGAAAPPSRCSSRPAASRTRARAGTRAPWRRAPD